MEDPEASIPAAPSEPNIGTSINESTTAVSDHQLEEKIHGTPSSTSEENDDPLFHATKDETRENVETSFQDSANSNQSTVEEPEKQPVVEGSQPRDEKPKEGVVKSSESSTTAIAPPSVEEEDTHTGATDGTATAATKKISAKELIQHVKNQKRKIQEKEAEIAVLESQSKLTRMRGLAVVIDLIGMKQTEKRKVRAFHRWLAFAERESAALEVERVAGLAHRASSEYENIKTQLEALQKEKADQDLAQKKLRVLLAKAKQQMSEQAKQHEQVPDGFNIHDVLRKTRGPDGLMWCLILVRASPVKTAIAAAAAPSVISSPATPSSSNFGGSSTARYEWREEALVASWLPGEKSVLDSKPTIEDELQERYSRATQELESQLSERQLELDAANDRFEQYRRRAEIALEKAESNVQVYDVQAETNLKDELSRVSRDRDSIAGRLEEFKARLDASESSLAALRLREKSLREERDELEQRVNEAGRALEIARATWEASLVKAENESEVRLRAERNEARLAEERAEVAERQLAQALARESELKENEKLSLDKLSRADDRIEALRASVARAEAKASSAQAQVTSLQSLSSSTQQHQQQHQQMNANNRLPSVSSALASPRFSNLQKHSSLPEVLEGDSASVAMGGEHGTRQRRDSGDSEMSNSIVGGSEMGSKYFVDQIGALRATHRNERVEWQRERNALRIQIDDAVKRKELAEENAASLEKRISDLNLANERQKQLADSARSISETPDGLLYLKNAVFRFITAEADSERETLLPVITMLLKFSPEEVQVLSQETVRPADQRGAGAAGMLSGLMSRWT